MKLMLPKVVTVAYVRFQLYGFEWENFWSAFLKLVAHGSSKMDSKPLLLPKLASFPMLVIFCLPAAFDASVALFAFVFVSVRNCANCVVKGGKLECNQRHGP